MHASLARILLASLGAVVLASAAIAPEFGASIGYAKGDPAFTVGAMRGKVVLMLFIQSWCPICNEWAPDLVGQLDQAYGSDPSVVLVAIKTDGDAEGGRTYLAEKGANPDRWLVASDAGGAYATSLLGKDELWQFAVLRPDGSLADSGKAGRYSPAGGKRTFVLASAQLGSALGKEVKPLLAGSYPTLVRAVRLAEAGCLGAALAAAQASRDPQAKAFRAEVLTAAAARVDTLAATVGDAAAPDRFPAFQALRALATQLTGRDPGRAAAKAVAEARKDKAIRRECDAERAWADMQARLAKLPPEKRADALAAALPRFAETFADTVHGRLAAAQQKR